MAESIAQLWARLVPELTTYFQHRLPNPADAEDFVSTTFLRLTEREGVTTPERLLRVIAKGLLLNEYRDHATQTPDVDERVWPGVRDRALALQLSVNGGGRREGGKHEASAILADQDAENLVMRFVPSAEDQLFGTAHDEAVRSLDPELRDAYILGELRGLPAREVGPLLGVSHTTAHVRREAATHTIRKEIAA